MNLRNYLKIIKSEIATLFNLDWLYSLSSFSQDGEDIILRKIFEGKKRGFYVDIGAHHPFRYSNTQFFYKKGWHGINIDATPGSMKTFKRARPKDINLELAIGDKNSKNLKLFVYVDSALNTFSKKRVEEIKKTKQSAFRKSILIPQVFLSDIFNRYAANKVIDFLSVDVEGTEIEVLKSNNWAKFKPKVIAVEILAEASMENLIKNPVTKYLSQKGYSFFARTLNTSYFKLKFKAEGAGFEPA